MLRSQTNNRNRVHLLALLLLLASAAHAEELPLKAYTIADGLPHNDINKIVRDSRGFLWFCTADGLSRFDGYAFTNYGTDHGLPHRIVNDLLETRNGEYWIATNGGLVLFTPNAPSQPRVVYANKAPANEQSMFMTVVPEEANKEAGVINVLFEDRSGTIWCGTYNGLYRLERASLSLRPIEVGFPERWHEGWTVNDLLEDEYRSLWIAAPSGLYRRWPDGSTARYTKRDGLPDEYLHDLLEDHQGQLWAATRYGGFFRFTADATHNTVTVVRSYAASNGLSTNWVFQLFETADHRFWVATNIGLVEFFPESEKEGGRRFHVYTEKNGLSYSEITALNEDTSGNVWLGTKIAGVMKLERNGFITYDQRDGLYQVSAIFEDPGGAVCFRGSVLGDEQKTVLEGAKSDLVGKVLDYHYTRLGRFDGTRFTWFKPNVISDFGWLMEGLTLQSHTGEWWVGTTKEIYRFPSTARFDSIKKLKPLAVYTTKDGFRVDQLYRLFEDSHGDVWVSSMTPMLLRRWDRASTTFHDLSMESGLSHSDLARSFTEDHSGNTWIGFDGALARYRNESLTFFTTDEGLPPGAITSIYPDHAGRLWLASARSGLIRIDDVNAERLNFINYTTAQGLSSNSTEVFADQLITEDRQGHIYIGTSRGVDRLDPPTGHIKHFTTADGLAAGSIKALFCDHNGVLWFGTGRGLSKFVPAPEESAASPPPILISDMHIAGSSSKFISALGESEIRAPDLAADQNQMQINFVGLTFGAGDLLHYQYKLEGADADWSTPTEQRSVNYARLAPGRYRFLVRAVNSDGVTSAKPAFITFRILSPLWERWWFLMSLALSLIFILYRLYRYRLSSLLELERVRTRIAVDLHDDIGSNLSLIAAVSDGLREEVRRPNGQVAERLSLIANVSQRSVDAMSDIVWTVNPQKDHLRDLTQRMRRFASDAFAVRNIEFQLDGPDEQHDVTIGAELRRELFLIFKESVNNAARHSSCSKADISLQIARGTIALQVSDNGRGFDPITADKGNGLVSMRQRAIRIRGRLQVISSAGAGTTILLMAPLK